MLEFLFVLGNEILARAFHDFFSEVLIFFGVSHKFPLFLKKKLFS
jgi:hypothetical protein